MVSRLLIRLRRDQRGFTLVEQLVVCVGLTFILGAIVGLGELATSAAPTDRERAHAVQEAQVEVDRMVRELRTAHAIAIEDFKATASIFDGAATVTVTYDCSATTDGGLRKCVRSGAGRPTQTVLPRVANASGRAVFTATQRADAAGVNWTTYVRVLVEVPSSGERKSGAEARIVLDDGFYLRNVDALH